MYLVPFLYLFFFDNYKLLPMSYIKYYFICKVNISFEMQNFSGLFFYNKINRDKTRFIYGTVFCLSTY